MAMPRMVEFGSTVLRADAIIGWQLHIRRPPGVGASYETRLFLIGGQTIEVPEQVETVKAAIWQAWRDT